MRKVLNVAEKASVAKDAAAFLAKGQQRSSQTLSKFNPVWSFNYNIDGNREDAMLFTSVTGHIMNIEFPPQYKNWNRINPEVLFREAEINRSVNKDKLKVAENIRSLAKKCNMLILWLDCDREGEAIAYEVIEICREANRNIQIYRAHFSAVTKRDIEGAMRDLRLPNKHLSDAVESRQEIDLRIGAALTRFQTLLLRPRFKDISAQVISYGPCQFPTLGFVVERYKRIQEFVPEPFCQMPDQSNVVVEFLWDRKHLFDKAIAETLFKKCKQNPQAVVISVQGNEKSRWRPPPLATIELQKIASRKLRIPSHRTMEIAEKLYTKGFISYPRTETDSFSNTINVQSLIGYQTSHSSWGQHARELLENGKFQWPKNGGHDDKAHPPIHPVKLVDAANGGSGLSQEELKIYELITRHFLACCSRDAKGFETTCKIDINGENFHANGLIIQEYNWLAVYPYEKWNAKLLPQYQQGQVFNPTALTFKESVTAPPQLLTEAELIGLMDKNGIGTDATIHEHIKTIQERGYATKQGGSGFFSPSQLGLALVTSYESMGIDLWRPNLRATMERNMTLIANGQLSKNEFLTQCLDELQQIYQQIEGKKDVMVNTMGNYFQPATAAGNGQFAVSADPEERKSGGLTLECGGCEQKTLDLYYTGNDGRIMSCGECNIDLRIPKKGEMKALDHKCPICSFQILEFKNEKGKNYNLCPWCYSNPPQPAVGDIENTVPVDPEAAQWMPCFKCSHNTCPHAKGTLNSKIMPCNVCKTHDMVVRKSKKDTYFLGCNGYPTCKNTIGVSDQIEHMEMVDTKCTGCDSRLVKLRFKNVELLDHTLKERLIRPNGDEFCLGGCDNHALQCVNYNYQRGSPTRPNQYQNSNQPGSPRQSSRSTGTASRATTSGVASPRAGGNPTGVANIIRKGFSILNNTANMINSGMVQSPWASSAAPSIGSAPGRAALREDKTTMVIAYEQDGTPGSRQASGQSTGPGSGLLICIRCRKIGHRAENCTNSQQVTVGISTQSRGSASTLSSRTTASFPTVSPTVDNSESKINAAKAGVTCFKCQQLGHSAGSCPNSAPNGQRRPFVAPRTQTIVENSNESSYNNANSSNFNSNNNMNYNNNSGGNRNNSSNNTNSYYNNNNNNGGAGNSSGVICFKCGEPGHVSTKCPNQGMPKRNDNNGSYGGGGSGNTSGITCFKCGEPGHVSNNCSNQGMPKRNANNSASGGAGGTERDTCYKCGQAGHWANRCPDAYGEEKKGGNQNNRGNSNNRGGSPYNNNRGGSPYNNREPSTETCFKCGEVGHWANKCPGSGGNQQSGGNNARGNWNNNNNAGYGEGNGAQNDFLANATCFKCEQKGHLANRCPEFGGGKAGKRNFTGQQGNGNTGAGRPCGECGQVGRHPRGSACPSVRRKKTKPQDDEYD